MYRSCGLKEQSVASHCEINSGCGHNESDKTTQNCHNNHEGKYTATHATEQNFSRLRRKRFARRNLTKRDEVYKTRAGQNINSSDNNHTVSHGARQGATRIAYFSAKLTQVPPSAK